MRSFNISEETVEQTVRRLRHVMLRPSEFSDDTRFVQERGALVKGLVGILYELGATEQDFAWVISKR